MVSSVYFVVFGSCRRFFTSRAFSRSATVCFSGSTYYHIVVWWGVVRAYLGGGVYKVLRGVFRGVIDVYMGCIYMCITGVHRCKYGNGGVYRVYTGCIKQVYKGYIFTSRFMWNVSGSSSRSFRSQCRDISRRPRKVDARCGYRCIVWSASPCSVLSPITLPQSPLMPDTKPSISAFILDAAPCGFVGPTV